MLTKYIQLRWDCIACRKFGSYGWGDGEWMRNWEGDCASNGIQLIEESVIANETPDDESLQACRNLGTVLAS